MRDTIFLLKRTSLSSPHRLKFLSQAHFSLSHISPHPNNIEYTHISPISSSKHPYSTTYSTLFLSLLFPISTFLSPYRIQIPNATKHIPISPTTIISTLPLSLFSLSLPPSHSNAKCHTTHPNISTPYHQYAPSPTLFSSFLTRPFANINSLFPLSHPRPLFATLPFPSLSSLNTFYSIIHHSP